MFIDTHAHLYAKEFDTDRTAMLDRARAAQVTKIFLPNVDSQTTAAMLALEASAPDFCYAMPGLHPCSVDANWESELAHVLQCLSERSWCGIGEIGLDLHWDKTFFEQQKLAFLQQIKWAKEFDLPIVIHSRSATADCLDLLEEEADERLRGIFHCFGGSPTTAHRITSLGFLLGIGGVATFKKSNLDETLQHVSLQHLVLETDAPYLAPVPHRGKRNESSYLPIVAQKIADIKGVTLEEVARATTDNAMQLFGCTI